MSKPNETILLGPAEEAARLWKGALESFERAGSRSDDDLVALCESLDLGLRAAEILVIGKLEPVRDDFPATVGLLLETPAAEVDPHRDATPTQRTLQFTDALDLLSSEELDCASPHLHRGWEDRRFACRRSRKTAQDAAGVVLGSEEREQLLLLAAYRNRIFRTPPPVRVVPNEIVSGFGSLKRLVEDLS